MAGNDNTRAPTIKDVAREAGVSFKTVSRVLNGNSSVNAEMRKSIEAAMERLDYRPNRGARSLRSKRSYTLALLWSRPPRVFAAEEGSALHDAPTYFADFLLELIIGCERGSRRGGYHMVLEFLDDESNGALGKATDALIADLAPDGIVIAPPLCDMPDLLDLLDERGVRYARLMPGTAFERGLCLMIDDFAAGREISEGLLEAGHRKFVFVSGPPNHIAAGSRYGGLAAAAANYPDAQIRVVAGDFSYDSGVRAAHVLLRDQDLPTAVFAANDAMAAGIINTATREGLSIPSDMSVVGFDDSFFAQLLTPTLTTVRQPTRELAKTATELLIEAVEGNEPFRGHAVRLPYEIIQRESTAAPRAG